LGFLRQPNLPKRLGFRHGAWPLIDIRDLHIQIRSRRPDERCASGTSG